MTDAVIMETLEMWANLEKWNKPRSKNTGIVDVYLKNLPAIRAADIFNRMANRSNNDPVTLDVISKALNLPYNKQIVMDFNQEDGDI